MADVTTLAPFDQNATLRNHPLIASAHAGGENRNTFEAFFRGFIGELRPVGAIEMTLAARAAGVAWRLNRAQGLETRILTKPDKYSSNQTPLEDALRSATAREAIDLVSRWEQGLERSLLKTLDVLNKMQRARRLRKGGETDEIGPDVSIVRAIARQNEAHEPVIYAENGMPSDCPERAPTD